MINYIHVYSSSTNVHLQCDRLIPDRIQRSLDGLSLLLYAVRVRDQLQLYVRITQTVRIHRNEIATLLDCVLLQGR